MRILAGLLFIFCIGKISSQEYDFAKANPIIAKKQYLNYLFAPDSNSNCGLIYASYQYLNIPKVQTFVTGGMHLKIGLNIARFFSKKFILGICFDIKPFRGFTRQNFTDNFRNDFNSNFYGTYQNSFDSVRAFTVKDAINNKVGHNFLGNDYYGIGICFSPFPMRYGGILLEVKRGYRGYGIKGVNDNEFFKNGNYTFLEYYVNKVYSAELSFKPYRLFSSSYINYDRFSIKQIYKLIVLSIYYERLDLTKSYFDKMPLNKIVSQSFIDKYAVTHNFGFKVGFTFY